MPRTPFVTLVTYNSMKDGKNTSAGIFSFLKCTMDGTTIAQPCGMGLKHTQGVKLTGEFLSFTKADDNESVLQWSGRFGPTIDVEAINTAFVDLDINSEGKWQVQANVLNTLIDNAAEDIKYCPVIVAEPYSGVKRCPLRPSPDI